MCRRKAILCGVLMMACSSTGDGEDAGRDGDSDSGVDSDSAIDSAVDVPDANLPEPLADYLSEGPLPVGNLRFELTDDARSRTLPVELWYPADESARAEAEAGQSIAAFEREPPRDEVFAGLLADAPDCVRAQTRSANAPAPAEGPWPLVVFSHCHSCTRFDVAFVAERLASFGIAVAAPDHEGNTLWDELNGESAAVGEEFLNVRVADMQFVRTALLEGTQVPDAVQGRFDEARVGVMGHSFGAATAGITAARDSRFRAGLAMAAPLTALGGDVEIRNLTTPFLFLVADEDNSIGTLGNMLIRTEHRRIDSASLLVEVEDAGHWSFSDYPGLVDLFAAGCGMGERQTVPGEVFSYRDPDEAREIAGGAAVGWFAQHFLNDPGGTTALRRGHPAGGVRVSAN
ncbi:MAG: hypothetical protein AAGE52_36635 [Myxococcota bacterium]